MMVFVLCQQLQIHMRSTHGEIEVFLCPDDPAVKMTSTSGNITTQQMHVPKPDSVPCLLPELVINRDVKVEVLPTVENCKQADQTMLSALTSAGMRDALLCESDDYGLMGGGKLQLQTEDQHMTPGRNIFKCVWLYSA